MPGALDEAVALLRAANENLSAIHGHANSIRTVATNASGVINQASEAIHRRHIPRLSAISDLADQIGEHLANLQADLSEQIERMEGRR